MTIKIKPVLVWQVYMVRCADDTLYTGVAKDVDKRLAQHNGLAPQGAIYTRSRRPVILVYQESASNRSTACRREYELKQLSRSDKLSLIHQANLSKPNESSPSQVKRIVKNNNAHSMGFLKK
jgi:putative endonuclease